MAIMVGDVVHCSRIESNSHFKLMVTDSGLKRGMGSCRMEPPSMMPLSVTEKEIPEVESSFSNMPTGSEQVLFVDDEGFLVDIGVEMLNDLGYTVEGKTSPREALEAFRANPDQYDIVITDMTMPEMTGEQLAMEIRKIRSDIPIIICSGYSKEMTQEKAEQIGICNFLNKPITMEDMATTIRKELDNR